MDLRRDLGLADPDGFYEELLDSMTGLDEKQAMLVMAKLILLLANQVGDPAVLRAALRAARKGVAP